MSVEMQFAKLLHRIQPTGPEIGRAKLHASTVKSRLQKTFAISKTTYIGSHARQTAIRGYSDLDLLVVFGRDEARWGGDYQSSQSFMGRVRADLIARYPATTIRRDGQAIVIAFGAGTQPIDVVPAIFAGPGPSNWPLYSIPDGRGGWRPTAPERHSKFLIDKDAQAGGKLKRVVQMIKYWRECREPRLPASSFHIELVLAESGVAAGVKSYPECLFDAFYLLATRQGRGLQDPLGVAGIVDAANTDAQRNALATAFEFARDHAWSARQAQQRGKPDEAKRQWDIVFNGRFLSRV